MPILKDITPEPNSKVYDPDEVITLTGKELNEMREKYELRGRRKMFNHWNEYFCSCEVNQIVRAAFAKMDADLTRKETRLKDVQI